MKKDTKNNYRIESDSIGEKKLAAESYFGINTIRALENFSLSRKKVHPDLIKSIAMIKYAAAQTNQEIDLLETDKAEAIKSAAQEIIEGEFDHLFKLDALQGGAGTSSNMMVNEIIANRALEIMGHQKGEYKYLHPNDDVNKGQSTNDVYPTALRIAVLNLLKKLTESIANLQDALQKKEKEFAGVIKLARTQLQDAVPITLGQEFSAYAEAVNRDRWRLYKITDRLKKINLGGTAVGTGLNTSWAYIYKIAKNIRAVSGLSLAHSENMIDITQNMDIFVEVSGLLKSAAVNLNKIANDLRLLASGPKGGLAEISLSEVQAGSSIMPGKVNPVICEMINQLVIEVISGDQAITLAAKEGQLELNAFAPSIAHHLLTMIEEMTNGIDIFINKTITKVEANPERCRELLEGSLAQLTALVPHIGYDNAVKIAKKVLKDDNKNIKELIVEEGLLSEAQLEELLTVEKMTGLYNL
ncbi:aspartate ammonia-lyase [Halanaerobium sp. Z-7514]|uniref:aspartate ammonia-lyase n=1 Tax=Halanaerobium polyolivorans TaxID=2886943 RepID=A0AAW4WVA6_9FIRM|nr:aspartate ammonia-lyase [Halanaerobium polyolivorans]MCC3144470.1 aspartate ammonia-lyase [Halanaerobium polyolivorans]